MKSVGRGASSVSWLPASSRACSAAPRRAHQDRTGGPEPAGLAREDPEPDFPKKALWAIDEGACRDWEMGKDMSKWERKYAPKKEVKIAPEPEEKEDISEISSRITSGGSGPSRPGMN